MSNGKIWLVVIGIVVGACLLGWLVRADGVRSDRATILARARAAKARKRKESAKAAGGSGTEAKG